MGAARHHTLIPVLGVAAAAASILAAPVPANADNWWPSRQFAHPENADDYSDGEVYREFLLGWWNESNDGYTKVYYKPRAAFFNGKKLTRSYEITPGGTYAMTWGDKGKYFTRVILYRKGEPYLTQIPHFAGNTALGEGAVVGRELSGQSGPRAFGIEDLHHLADFLNLALEVGVRLLGLLAWKGHYWRGLGTWGARHAGCLDAGRNTAFGGSGVRLDDNLPVATIDGNQHALLDML